MAHNPRTGKSLWRVCIDMRAHTHIHRLVFYWLKQQNQNKTRLLEIIYFPLRRRSSFYRNLPSCLQMESHKQTRFYNTNCLVGICNKLCLREIKTNTISFLKFTLVCVSVWKLFSKGYLIPAIQSPGLDGFDALSTVVYCFTKGCYLATAWKKLLVL